MMIRTDNAQRQQGMILLTVLVLLSVMMGIAMSMLQTMDNNVQVILMAKRAAIARLAAMSAFNYAAGILVQDASSSPGLDHLAEDWHMATHSVGGASAPYTAFTHDFGNGYFVNDVYDLSGRIPSGGAAFPLYTRYTGVVVRPNAATISSTVEKTPFEINEYGGITYGYTTYFNPYDVTGKLINLNTIAQLSTFSSASDDITTTIQSTGPITATGAERMLMFRRHPTASGTGLNFASQPSYAPGIKDYDIGSGRIFSTYPIPTSTIVYGWNTAPYIRSYTEYGTISSAGYFMIHAKAFLATAAGVGSSSRLGENRIFAVVKRTGTTFTTIYFRWFWEDADISFTY